MTYEDRIRIAMYGIDIMPTDSSNFEFEEITADGVVVAYSIYAAEGSEVTEWVLPYEYEGLPITRIASSGFAGVTVETIKIPKSITHIGGGAFTNTTGLTLIMPDSVKVLEGQIIEEAYGVTVCVPDSVISINSGICGVHCHNCAVYCNRGSYAEARLTELGEAFLYNDTPSEKIKSRYIKIGNIKIGKCNKYVFEDIEGVTGGEINYQEEVFAETDGAEYSEIMFRPRQLTIKGTIIASTEEELQILKQNLIKTCNPKQMFDVYYYNGFTEYYARGMADGPPEFAKRQKTTMRFVIYIKIPSFYWLTNADIVTYIFRTEPRLSSTFTFPGAFSIRTSDATVINDGETETYPIIELSCTTPNTSTIIITNETQNKTLHLNYTMTSGEKIIIDMYNRSIISSINGSLLNYLDRTDNFWSIQMGENHIAVETTYITAVMKHRNRYIGV